ncbi:MAG: hypothetical protein GF313_03190 [Caldithrix sp.]|nr:hypothetical protein [Caldithrix sp.]
MYRLVAAIKKIFRRFDLFSRQKAVAHLHWEIDELEHIFTLLVMGGFIGLPAPPVPITFELIPYMENDIRVMLDKIPTSAAPLSELFSNLDVN